MNLWRNAPGAWQPLSTMERQVWPESMRAPLLWEYLSEADRDLVAETAIECLHREPHVQAIAFGSRLFDRLRERRAAATSAAEQTRLHGIEMVISQHSTTTTDLLYRLRGRGDLLCSLKAQRRQVEELIARLERDEWVPATG